MAEFRNMHYLHLTEKFEKKISKYPQKDLIYKTIEEYICSAKHPERLRSVSSFPKKMLVYKRNDGSRVILQKKTLNIGEDEINVLFARDFIFSRDMDYYWAKKNFLPLKNGTWLESNPLPSVEGESFTKHFLESKPTSKQRCFPPNNLNDWLNEYELKVKFDIYETEHWVRYSTNRGANGLEEKYILSYKRLFNNILNNNNDLGVKSIEKGSPLKYVVDKDDRVGVTFARFNDECILVYGGAHTLTQKELWKKCLDNLKSGNMKFSKAKENISKEAIRAYPKWVLNYREDENRDDLWCLIQRSRGINNLSLLPEQVNFLNSFNFPCYINGQAGSGKSTMLYYIFANVYYYKCCNMFDGDVIFLTENKNLIKDTRQSLVSLLQLNPQFNGISIDQIASVEECLTSFKDFLISLLPPEEAKKYGNKFLDFGVFKTKYNERFDINNKISAEEVWFVLSTYVYGYFEDKVIDTREKYLDLIPSKFRLIEDGDSFDKIIEHGLGFYKKLLDDGWWDKNTLVRAIRENFPKELPKQYTVIFCDEAQDFSRIELRLMIEASVWNNYDLSNKTQQVPIVFAGDALQTVNPVGFSTKRLHQMFYEILLEKGFEYDKEKSTYSPTYNYRSIASVVRIANVVQSYRTKVLEAKGVKQTAKLQGNQSQKPIIYSIEWLEKENNVFTFKEKFKYKSFIIPVDLNEEKDYKANNQLINDGLVDVKSSIAAKGAEYAQVVVYGFGKEYIEAFSPINWLEKKLDFKINFFFNKLYVAITRAQKELVIIDSKESIDNFWKPLLEQKTAEKWEDLNLNDLVDIEPETLNSILDSNKDDALENAKVDFELGKRDKNVARLSVAKNIFFQLGENEKGYECEAHRLFIKGDWSQSGKFFIKANQKEEAANVFFHNKLWEDLRTCEMEMSEKHELRLLIAVLIDEKKWSEFQLRTVHKTKHHISELVQDVPWREDFVETMESYTKEVEGKSLRRLCIAILEGFVNDNDYGLLEIIADHHFSTRQYDYAIETWDKITKESEDYELPLSECSFYHNYLFAHIEKAKDENNLANEILWSGRLMDYFSGNNSQQHELAKKMLSIYKEDVETVLGIDPKEEILMYLYLATIIQPDLELLPLIGTKVEECNAFSSSELLSSYEKNIKRCSNESVSLFLKERWAKVFVKSNPRVDSLNKVFKEKEFPFEEEPFEWTEAIISKITGKPSSIPQRPPNFYQHFSVENFKGFVKLELDNLGQYNLVLGNNNVGKTSLLEAFTLSSDINDTCENLAYVLKQRNPLKGAENIFEEFLNNKSENKKICYKIQSGRRKWGYQLSSSSNVFSEIDKKNAKKILMTNDEGHEEGSVNLEDIKNVTNGNFIPFGKGYTNDLASLYYEIVGKHGKKSKDAFRNDVMKFFIPNIIEIDVDPINGEIKIEEEDSPPLSLYNYGEGANKLFRIMVQLYAAKGKRLAIDEIDAGIHYRKFKGFWKIILKAAQKMEVQLFASTHNEECIGYFITAISELELELDKKDSFKEEARVITLEQHVNEDEIIPIIRSFRRLEYTKNYEIDLRGYD